ncbi:MAG: peptidyl-prolyl cis-trans isomerase, partial [Gammaproteobacteria bacterium]|nr:peptidyl-prolyl cis-trans isomerase [Gammaproteobacteria bacterium]
MNASWLHRILREPLVHFLAIGAGLFLVYAIVQPHSPTADSRINIDRYELQRLAALWQAQWKRPPTQDELTRLVADRVREEVLYREALALNLDENDVLVRRRLAQKLEMALNDVAALVEPADEDLRRYFDAHAQRYVEPAELTLTHRFF